jgi:predicted SAM-dependent methyltransferase
MSHQLTIRKYIARQKPLSVKLHLGCGGRKLVGYVNVDLYPSDPDVTDSSRSGCAADVFCDIRNLDLDPESVDEIFLSHVIEHFVRWEALDAFRSWHGLLKPGAVLIMETPDFFRCILMLLHPKKKNRIKARTQFYGNQWDRLEYETHRYLWTPADMRRALLDAGFSRVKITHRTTTHKPGRDMRVVAWK